MITESVASTIDQLLQDELKLRLQYSRVEMTELAALFDNGAVVCYRVHVMLEDLAQERFHPATRHLCGEQSIRFTSIMHLCQRLARWPNPSTRLHLASS